MQAPRHVLGCWQPLEACAIVIISATSAPGPLSLEVESLHMCPLLSNACTLATVTAHGGHAQGEGPRPYQLLDQTLKVPMVLGLLCLGSTWCFAKP